jgi:tagatose-6-phosphate ketose/aldose isomerase
LVSVSGAPIETIIAVPNDQLGGLVAAYSRGVNVDEPFVQKALDRTVQGVHIYDRRLFRM